ncbi:MAG TPA: LamG-like jellyroll fold domain-containing protein [Gemmatimonadales bacterium]
MLIVAACAEPVLGPSAPQFSKSAGAGAGASDNGGSALVFDGSGANTSTALGNVITRQTDDISYDLMVRYDGPNAANNGQAIFYNGHGAVTGWGILALGPSDGVTDGTIAILAGGITVDITPLVLTPGVWQHLVATRQGQVVTVALDGQTFNAGGIGVHPLGGPFRSIERTTVGGSGTFNSPEAPFHGAIDDLTVRDLNTDTVIEHWGFNEGSGHSASSDNGTVLCLGTTAWTAAQHPASQGNTALLFNGCDANTSTPLGSVVTTQIDDIAYDAMVRYDGTNAGVLGQALFYNGHGGVSGWGILVLGQSDGVANGTIAVLAGGITVAFTPLQLTRGAWQHITAERRAGDVVVTLSSPDGTGPDQTFDAGVIPVHPVGQGFAGIERTTVGGSGTFDIPAAQFHGAVDNFRIRDLVTDTWIERWNFNERTGSTATGANGTVLQLGNTTHTGRGGND